MTADFEEVLDSTGEVRVDEQSGVLAPGEPLESREIRHYRVRIETGAGWGKWSSVLTVEAGLHEAADWRAEAVTLPDDPGSERQSPSPLLRHEFDLPAESRRRGSM